MSYYPSVQMMENQIRIIEFITVFLSGVNLVLFKKLDMQAN